MYFNHMGQGIGIDTDPTHSVSCHLIYQRRYTILPRESLVKHSDSYFTIKPIINIHLKTVMKEINNIEKYMINTKVRLNYSVQSKEYYFQETGNSLKCQNLAM
jgi:hypothetical protein